MKKMIGCIAVCWAMGAMGASAQEMRAADVAEMLCPVGKTGPAKVVDLAKGLREVDKGVDAADKNGRTLLMTAAEVDNRLAVAYLVALGADVTKTDKNKMSVEKYACSPTVKTLLSVCRTGNETISYENKKKRALEQGLDDPAVRMERIKLLVTQRVEGDEMEEGMRLLRDLYAVASQDRRQTVPVSKLRVGLKCGGSDGFSGITANPLVGEFSDWLVAQGGTSVLTEVPEMFGAETILMNRCRTEGLFKQTVSMINNFKEYFLSHGEPVGENPSPGNKAGGISTLEDKALGCTQKCGKAPVSGVMEYGERLQHEGLNLLSAPGNDLVAATALASCGCHLVLFTTGRGTPFGTFVPTMKIATNPTLAARKPTWVDFSAGQLIEGRTMQELVPEFIDKILSVASGEKARNEENDYREIAIFKTGVTL